MRKRNRLISGAVLTLLSHAVVAHAQATHSSNVHEARDQHLEFDDDLLQGGLSTPFGDPVFTRHLRPGRVQLIRPRTSFVPELYKSVEHI